MPSMDGFTLVEQIRTLKNGASLPVIILGMMSRKVKRTGSEKDRLISVINKPVKYNSLRDILRQQLYYRSRKISPGSSLNNRVWNFL